MGSNESSKIEKILAEEYERFAPQLDKYQWPWETARWHELVFCLLCQVDDSPQTIAIARETVDILAKLDLLKVDALAECVAADNKPDYQSPSVTLMIGVMKQQGYSEEEQKKAIGAICQVARSLQTRFDGKVQKYLRKYGEQMLHELSENLPLDQLNGAEVERAVTHWLQNVLNMPLAFSNSQVEAFCQKTGIKMSDLVEIADRNDINLAVVDDWAIDYMRQESVRAGLDALPKAQKADTEPFKLRDKRAPKNFEFPVMVSNRPRERLPMGGLRFPRQLGGLCPYCGARLPQFFVQPKSHICQACRKRIDFPPYFGFPYYVGRTDDLR